ATRSKVEPSIIGPRSNKERNVRDYDLIDDNPILMVRPPMNTRSCLFCTNPLTERAREHVIPQWLIDYLGVRDEDLLQGIAQTQDGALLKQRTHVAQTFVEGRVCKECNNGWMSSLENQVRSLLTDLMSGQRTLHAL